MGRLCRGMPRQGAQRLRKPNFQTSGYGTPEIEVLGSPPMRFRHPSAGAP